MVRNAPLLESVLYILTSCVLIKSWYQSDSILRGISNNEQGTLIFEVLPQRRVHNVFLALEVIMNSTLWQHFKNRYSLFDIRYSAAMVRNAPLLESVLYILTSCVLIKSWYQSDSILRGISNNEQGTLIFEVLPQRRVHNVFLALEVIMNSTLWQHFKNRYSLFDIRYSIFCPISRI